MTDAESLDYFLAHIYGKLKFHMDWVRIETNRSKCPCMVINILDHHGFSISWNILPGYDLDLTCVADFDYYGYYKFMCVKYTPSQYHPRAEKTRTNGGSISFEEFLDVAPKDIKNVLLFNLDIFTVKLELK